MTRVMQQTALCMIAMVFVAAVPFLQGHLDRQRTATPNLQGFMYLPQGEYLRIAVLGYEQVAADLLWIQAIQAMGERTKMSAEMGIWLARLLDLITTLDPRFLRVYEAGGIALTTFVHLPEESNKLLQKGMGHNPDVWQLPFLLGFNYYFDLYDDQKAAEYIAKASRLPGAPEYLAGFAARLYVSARSPQVAIDFLTQVYTQTRDETVKRILEQRLKEVVVERDLLRLEEAIGRYRQMAGSPPDDLKDLMRRGILHELPAEPFGGRYLYDPRTQTVRSSVVKERMKLYGNRTPR
jgi:hypothetical protein